VLVKICADGVAVIDRAVRCAREDAQTGELRAVRVLHTEVAIEGIVVAGEEADAISTPLPGPASQFIDLRLRDKHETRSLQNMGRDRVVAISPHTAHNAGLIVIGRKHQVIYD